MKQGLNCLVLMVGLLVCGGWIAGVDQVTRVIPGAVTMKFTTALSFILAGLGGLGADKTRPAEQLVRHGLAMLLFCLQVAILLVGPMTYWETEGAVLTVRPGEPSMMTIVAFILCAFMMWSQPWAKVRQLTWALVTIGLVAIVGHVVGSDGLQWHSDGNSTAMAVHTAVCFVCLGVSYKRQPKPGTAGCRWSCNEGSTE